MSKYRKKPVVIDAVQWTGKNHGEIHEFTERRCKFTGDARYGFDLTIPTLEGDMTAHVGDWIIRGVQGEFYPCKPDIFEQTYEPVSA